jgi:hypothetical protein
MLAFWNGHRIARIGCAEGQKLIPPTGSGKIRINHDRSPGRVCQPATPEVGPNWSPERVCSWSLVSMRPTHRPGRSLFPSSGLGTLFCSLWAGNRRVPKLELGNKGNGSWSLGTRVRRGCRNIRAGRAQLQLSPGTPIARRAWLYPEVLGKQNHEYPLLLQNHPDNLFFRLFVVPLPRSRLGPLPA